MKKSGNPHVTLVVGGARSGKSRFAQNLTEKLCRRPCYLATAEILDDEMADRIKRHRQERGHHWSCIEEPLDIAPIIKGPAKNHDGILLDCVTLWLSNIMLKEGLASLPARQAALYEALSAASSPVILVSNEVGMGIVPDNNLARDFRDHAGWLNQALAEVAGQVVFVAVGLPLLLKGTLPCED